MNRPRGGGPACGGGERLPDEQGARCSVRALREQDDAIAFAPRDGVAAWREATTAAFSMEAVPAGLFFHDRPEVPRGLGALLGG